MTYSVARRFAYGTAIKALEVRRERRELTLREIDNWLEDWARVHRKDEPLHIRRPNNPRDRTVIEQAPVSLSSLWQQWLSSKWWQGLNEAPPSVESIKPPDWEHVRAIEWAMGVEPKTKEPRMQKRHRRWITKWYVQKRGDVSQEMLVHAQQALIYRLQDGGW